MGILLIIGTFEALFLVILVAAIKNKNNSDFFLGLIFFVDALSLGFAYLQYYNTQNAFPMTWALNIGFVFMYLHGPALWFYIRSQSARGLRFKAYHLLHFLPFLIFLAMQMHIFVFLDPAEKIQIIISESFKSTNFYKAAILCVGASTISYYLWGLKQLREHRQQLKLHFSRIDDKDLNWLRILIIISLIMYAINAIVFNLDMIFQLTSFKVLMLFGYGFASVYILVMGFFGLRQGNVFIRIEETETGSLKSGHRIAENNICRDPEHEFAQSLKEFMNTAQPYLDPELTLSGLASQLKVQADYLSLVLNRYLKMNFFDFINTYRIEEFKIQAGSDSNSHLSIIGIAYNCGFNSKAAFYRAFQKRENVSPGDYIKGIKRK